MGIRLRSKHLIKAGLVGAGITLVLSASGGYIAYNKVQENEIALKEKYLAEVEELSLVAEQSNIQYSLKANVKRGDPITKDMLTEVYLPDAATAINALQDFQFDTSKYFARTDMPANTVMTESLLYMEEHLEDDVRATEYATIELPSKLKVNDYVDVRIQFPNGEDYIVFSKKKVVDVQGVTLWLENDEAEILSMSSALVDAFLQEGKLYAITYVDGEMQEKSEITYPVNAAVRDLISRDPNIVNIAKLNLETQNRASLENNLRALDQSVAEKVRQKENEFDTVKKQEDKERQLIEMNQSPNYENTEIVNDSIEEDIVGGE